MNVSRNDVPVSDDVTVDTDAAEERRPAGELLVSL